MNSITVINLTGITISYRDKGVIKTIPPSGWRLLAERRFNNTGLMLGEANVATRVYEVPNVPPKVEGQLFLVDPIVAEAMQAHGIHRDDVVVSHGASAERATDKTVLASRTFYLANP